MQQRLNHHLVEVHPLQGLRILHRQVHLLDEVEAAQQREEEPSAEQQENGHHHVGDRLHEKGRDLAAGNHQCISHCAELRPASTSSSSSSASASGWPRSCAIALRKTSSSDVPAGSLSRLSSSTTWPSLMITTLSQICDTSGRIWVDSTMVRVPPRSRISARISRICRGSSPIVGSSRINTGGSWMIDPAR